MCRSKSGYQSPYEKNRQAVRVDRELRLAKPLQALRGLGGQDSHSPHLGTAHQRVCSGIKGEPGLEKHPEVGLAPFVVADLTCPDVVYALQSILYKASVVAHSEYGQKLRRGEHAVIFRGECYHPPHHPDRVVTDSGKGYVAEVRQMFKKRAERHVFIPEEIEQVFLG